MNFPYIKPKYKNWEMLAIFWLSIDFKYNNILEVLINEKQNLIKISELKVIIFTKLKRWFNALNIFFK